MQETEYLLARYGNELDDAEKFVIHAMFGIGCEPLTYVEIGRALGTIPRELKQKTFGCRSVSGTRAKQICIAALHGLRAIARLSGSGVVGSVRIRRPRVVLLNPDVSDEQRFARSEMTSDRVSVLSQRLRDLREERAALDPLLAAADEIVTRVRSGETGDDVSSAVRLLVSTVDQLNRNRDKRTDDEIRVDEAVVEWANRPRRPVDGRTPETDEAFFEDKRRREDAYWAVLRETGIRVFATSDEMTSRHEDEVIAHAKRLVRERGGRGGSVVFYLDGETVGESSIVFGEDW